MQDFIFLFIIGCLGGVISGMFGIGGGVIYVVVFSTYLKRVFPILAQHETILVQLTLINSIFSIFFGALSGVLKQLRMKNFETKNVLQTAIPALITAILGTVFISHWTGYNKNTFFIIFTVFLFPMLFKLIPTKAIQIERQQIDQKYFTITGIITGFCTAFTGLGGGVVINPILHGLLKYPIKKTFSISQGVMLITTLGITIYHLFFKIDTTLLQNGHFFRGINFTMTFPTIVGMMIFAPIGVELAQKTPPKLLQLLFAIVCFTIIIRNLYQIFGS